MTKYTATYPKGFGAAIDVGLRGLGKFQPGESRNVEIDEKHLPNLQSTTRLTFVEGWADPEPESQPAKQKATKAKASKE